jgi:hypothetical protein
VELREAVDVDESQEVENQVARPRCQVMSLIGSGIIV